MANMQVLNFSLTLAFGIFAYVCFIHTNKLLSTSIGRSLLSLITMHWVRSDGRLSLTHSLVLMGFGQCYHPLFYFDVER
jgi:Ca2+/Na+ antiporter